MRIGRKLVIALDVDDVLFICLARAVKEAQRRGCDVEYEQIIDYYFKNLPAETGELLLKIMQEPRFYQDQEVLPGAVEMVDELLAAGHEVIIASAVFPKLMGYRSEMLLSIFPKLNPRNIMLGARKDLLHVDFLLDDHLDNIKTSPAKYPVLFTQPWNKDAQDFLRVSSYREFIQLVEAVSLAPEKEKRSLIKAGRPGILCLVGPSASGKSFICDELVRNPMFRKVRAMATRKPRPGDMAANEYVFVNEENFLQHLASGELVESTVYNGQRYGIAKEEIEQIWHDGRIAIKPVDISGAPACKKAYGDRCATVFVRRSKEDIVNALLERDCPNADKAGRLLSLDAEMGNESLCDWTVSNNGTLDYAVQQILKIVE